MVLCNVNDFSGQFFVPVKLFLFAALLLHNLSYFYVQKFQGKLALVSQQVDK